MNAFDQLVDDVDLASVIARELKSVHFSPCRSCEPDLWFDGDRFIKHLGQYSYLDVATYSFSLYCKHLKIDRLITGLPMSKYGAIKPKQYKNVSNNHSKIFICYRTIKITRRPKRVTIDSVFVGSQNLTSGTNFNLMYKVDKQHEQPIVNFFEQMWRGK